MDYEKKYNEAVKRAKAAIDVAADKDLVKGVATTIFPELRESEDERIIGCIKKIVGAARHSQMDLIDDEAADAILSWLEKQKEASKAIEAVERIDKYIDEHVANAHDMRNSNPDKKYYRGWDDALGKMAGILQDVYSNEKQKEQPISAEEVLVRAGLKPYKDGNQWCILVGDNIQEGICGFGDTIEDALYEFLKEVLDLQKKQKPNIEICPHSVKSKSYSETGCPIEDFDYGLEIAYDILEKTFGDVEGYQTDDGIREHQTAIKAVKDAMKEQKPAEQSEEDEKIRLFLLDHAIEMIAGLESDISHSIYDGIKGHDPDAEAELNQWKKVRAYLSSRPKSSDNWKPSEQEKGALRTAIHILTEERNFPKAAAHLQAILDAFDGKESRKDWKPSKDQMEAFKIYLYEPQYIDNSEDIKIKLVESLYNDLKKLM